MGAPQMTSHPVSSIFHCPLGLGKLQACPFLDVVFPPLPLSAWSSSPFHCALQDGYHHLKSLRKSHLGAFAMDRQKASKMAQGWLNMSQRNPCKMVLARPDEWETCPYHFSLHLFTMVRRSLCGLIACWILAQTSLLVMFLCMRCIVLISSLQ